MLERIQTFRRDLHRIPELELHLPKTQRYIQEALRDLPCTLSSPIPSSVVAFLMQEKRKALPFAATWMHYRLRKQPAERLLPDT